MPVGKRIRFAETSGLRVGCYAVVSARASLSQALASVLQDASSNFQGAVYATYLGLRAWPNGRLQ